MVEMGYNREDIRQSLDMLRYDHLYATYHLLVSKSSPVVSIYIAYQYFWNMNLKYYYCIIIIDVANVRNIDVKNLEKGIKNLKKPGFNPKNKKP